MDTGTKIHFVWHGEGRIPELESSISSFLESEECEKTSPIYWEHELFGKFSMVFKSTTKGDSACFSFDCELLPELNDPVFERPPQPPSAIYHLARKIFSLFDADECFAGTLCDGVLAFNFNDTLIDRIFRFSKYGPQKLVLPYEENRAVIDSPREPDGYSDTRFNVDRGEPNYVLRRAGPLKQ